jgi:endoglucanase
MRCLAVLLLLGVTTGAPAQPNPVKLAARARLDLTATAGVGSLTGGISLRGNGTVNRMVWRPAAEQPFTYTLEVPAPHFAWTEFLFRFTPASSGLVEIKLLGPWDRADGGDLIYRQEIFWDELSATNTTLLNGGFEFVNGNLPLHWVRPYGDAVAATGPVPATHGLRYARVWHDSPLSQSLSVTGGVPVTLRLSARAVVPEDYVDMARIADTNSPAHQAARGLRRGVNLGNYLEAPPDADWGATYSTNDFHWIRAEGFDHVRLPVAWQHYTGPGPAFLISNRLFQRVDFLVTNALDRGLGVMLNIHHFDDFTSDPPAWTNKFFALWEQIAAYYSNAPARLVFELLNEPKDAASTRVLNPIYAETIRRIRTTNPTRTLVVGPGRWNSADELPNLRLPDGDSNLVVSVHSYEPFLLTHQGAFWTFPDTASTGIVFPGPPVTPVVPAAGIGAWATNWIREHNTRPAAENPSSPRAFRSRLQLAAQWSAYYGRPVHVGEFGCYHPHTDAASRVRFHAAMRQCLDELGLGWALWDWKAGFHYWQQTGDTGAPDPPGLREALFP